MVSSPPQYARVANSPVPSVHIACASIPRLKRFSSISSMTELGNLPSSVGTLQLSSNGIVTHSPSHSTSLAGTTLADFERWGIHESLFL